jgi:hypothetical protein
MTEAPHRLADGRPPGLDLYAAVIAAGRAAGCGGGQVTAPLVFEIRRIP